MKQMKKKTFLLLTLIAAFVGTFFVHVLGFIPFGRMATHHVCQCERCKLIRQLEAVEVLDSVIQDRIVININKEE